MWEKEEERRGDTTTQHSLAVSH